MTDIDKKQCEIFRDYLTGHAQCQSTAAAFNRGYAYKREAALKLRSLGMQCEHIAIAVGVKLKTVERWFGLTARPSKEKTKNV